VNILDKIKKANLVGRGGSGFPTAVKWEMAKKAAGNKKYVICNASEGEPGVNKDGYILENFGEKIIDGMKIAIDFLSAISATSCPSLAKDGVSGYIYINRKYYKKFSVKLNKIIAGDKKYKIELFVKPNKSGYIGGEETALLNAMEGKRVEPRMRPPFPTASGLWGCPTLVNNVETFYNVSLVAGDEYQKNRFYTIGGDCLNGGVYELPDNLTIKKILKETGNYPKFDFFVQVGGDISGEVLNNKQLNKLVGGVGSITIYNAGKYKPEEMMKKWIDFLANESCGQCAPCREGIYRLSEIINSDNPNWKLIQELLNNLDEASFCGLGGAAPVAIRSYKKNILKS